MSGRLLVRVAPAAALVCALAVGSRVTPASGASARSLSPGDHVLTVKVGTLTRTMLVHVPPGPATAGRPLLLVFHGATDTAQSTKASTDFTEVADSKGEVVAFLQGYKNTWNEGTGDTPAAQAHVNDLQFTVDAIARLKAVVPFDHRRIIAVGFSNGALMVEYLGCRIAPQLAMVVPVEGELAKATAATCAPSVPVRVYEVHGTADSAIYYSGGPVDGHGTVVISAPASALKWATLDHCMAKPTTVWPRSGVKLTIYRACRAKVDVTLRTIVGGMHVWGSNIGHIVASVLPPG